MYFIERFFEDLDVYLEQNINTISCDELANLYFRFIAKIESYFANTRDFTGLTEFIIFRALHHLFSEEINKGELELIANALVGKRQPDIVLRYNNEFYTVISVKSNMDTGYSRITKDFNKTQELAEQYHNIKTLTISFDNKVTTGQIKFMETKRSENPFYNFIFLRKNPMKFKDIAYTYVFNTLNKEAGT
ncbi:hypothetical protein ACIQD3_09400 [Peribacillus loiseleuriae]|uniref:hypothetical protein n=1 Tax=Peribacillus loiseleuriae TaxID=1679170 RepID=UPI00382F80E5